MEATKPNKKVLLISHNFFPEPTGIGKYNGEMIEWFANNGYNCTVITTYPYYPHWKVQAPYKNRWYKKEIITFPETEKSVTVFRCPSYVPSNPSGKKRILQDFSFWTSMIWRIVNIIMVKQKFDLIITVAPPFHLAYLGLMIKKRTGGKLLYHIQDLQIEAAQELKMIKNERFLNRIFDIEKQIMLKADFVSSISDGMISKIQQKIDKKVLFFPNWADTNIFFPLSDRKTLKLKWGYELTDIVFLYSGAIGEKQGVESVLLAAEELKDRKHLKFIICGSGPYKEILIQIAKEKQLTNVRFLPVQEKEVFNEFLNMADGHLILQKTNASDLVMPSKLTTILAVGGVSIVTASSGTSLHDVVERFNLGYMVEPENTKVLLSLLSNFTIDEKFNLKAENARNYALKYLKLDNVMLNFCADIFDEVAINA